MKCIITFLPALALVGSVPTASVTQSNYRNDLSGGARTLMHLRQLGLSSDAHHNTANQTMLSADVVVMHATIETHLAALGVNQERRAWLLSHGRSWVQAKHYDRWNYVNEKREDLSRWARYLDALAGLVPIDNVVKIRGRA